MSDDPRAPPVAKRHIHGHLDLVDRPDAIAAGVYFFFQSALDHGGADGFVDGCTSNTPPPVDATPMHPSLQRRQRRPKSRADGAAPEASARERFASSRERTRAGDGATPASQIANRETSAGAASLPTAIPAALRTIASPSTTAPRQQRNGTSTPARSSGRIQLVRCRTPGS
jgi:hypothetical protein